MPTELTPITVTDHLWIPLPDGRRLAARMWCPEGEGPFPAILEYLPYRKRDGTAPRDATTHPVFAAHGYACIRVDIAGSGDSDGRFDDEYSEQELADGEAVLDWIAAQGWSTGKVGMIGISWGGFNGLQLAFRRPAPLRAVVSVASTVDRYADDIHYMGGCLLSDNKNWSSQMFAYMTRPLDPDLRPDWREEWLGRIRELPFMGAEWLKHQTRDDFWKHGSICEDWSAITAPVLAITGWADAYVNAPPAIASNLSSAPGKALMGPWEHRYGHISKLQASDFHGEVLRWFDQYLKGEETGAAELPDYRAFVQDHFNPTAKNTPRKGRWVAEAQWPSPHVQEVTWPLAVGGFAQAPETGRVTVSNPATLGQAGGYFCAGMRIDNELPEDQQGDDALSLCFDTDALAAPLELLGRPRVRLRFQVDKPVAQVMARLCDVAPDGVSQRISYRARNLCHDDSHEHATRLVPGEVYEVDFELNECAHRLAAGHRLRLALSTSYWPIVWPAPEVAQITLELEGCALILPERRVQDEIDPVAPPPARDYPVLAATDIRPASGRSNRQVTADGRHVLETFDDYGKAENPDHGLVVGSSVMMRYSIHPDDPSTACFESDWTFEFARGDWQVEVLTENRMTCDRTDFHLWRKVVARENGAVVLTQEWRESVPRGVL
ncbi:CocE/NonD family hydrolase [Tritonibacter horizontis]|uniref:Cocaine esterase n=1 Tax=Tritonibacter horizontis TaxID=1768241 RepID=A0A132BSI9_9RHOB|nr:CocE/NonD family hydrolase [Tritonibacter horizontis]KUP90720.1 cocaine esterase [Tritonibacter horizontis]